MKQKWIITSILVLFLGSSCTNKKIAESDVSSLETNALESGTKMEITFLKGREHNHPTFAIWIEDMEGNFIETLYVTKYLGTGIYGHGSLGAGKWDNKPGKAERPSTLPYWLHKRTSDTGASLPNPENPIPDAITAATPVGNFVLRTTTGKTVPEKFRILMEINQPWDWNEYWNNTKYPDDLDYKSSCQPALVYAVTIDKNKKGVNFYLNPIGHSHYAGKNGELYTDLSTFTTAKEIVDKVFVHLN